MRSRFSNLTFILVIALTYALAPALSNSNSVSAWPQQAATSESVETAEPAPQANIPRGEFRSILKTEAPPAASRAWEWRPYQVAVWLCIDGSPDLRNIESQLCADIEKETEILDPSGWDATVGTPPSRWRWLFLNSIFQTEKLVGFEEEPELAHYDKLMVVCLRSQLGKTKIEVREFDVRTRQWGPIVTGETAKRNLLSAQVTRLISQAFMPLANVHSLSEDPKTRKDTVYLRTRGVKSCVRVELNDDFEPEPMPIRSSPCFVRENDYFLPILRKTDRKGNLIRLDPIEFTFLTIDSLDGAEVSCSIQSGFRAPLAGRKSKKNEKLALVIRPPARSTKLTLISQGEDPRPMEGFDIISVKPGDPDKTRELIGTTDWKGEIEIPPIDEGSEGMRLIYPERAGRALRKLPLIPGFHAELVAALPDDDARLYAESVIKGLENEILNLVIQRKIYEEDMSLALEQKNREEAVKILRDYKDLESPQDIKARMANEEISLKARSNSKREIDFITLMFGTLKKLLDSEVVKTRESELQQRLQQLN